MEIVRWEPFEGFNGLHNRMNELFEEAFSRSRPYQASGASAWWPPVDILTSEGWLSPSRRAAGHETGGF